MPSESTTQMTAPSPDELGQPHVTLSGETARIAGEKGITRVLLSITHTNEYAAASAIGMGDEAVAGS